MRRFILMVAVGVLLEAGLYYVLFHVLLGSVVVSRVWSNLANPLVYLLLRSMPVAVGVVCGGKYCGFGYEVSGGDVFDEFVDRWFGLNEFLLHSVIKMIYSDIRKLRVGSREV